jgi:hypothetical protein
VTAGFRCWFAHAVVLAAVAACEQPGGHANQPDVPDAPDALRVPDAPHVPDAPAIGPNGFPATITVAASSGTVTDAVWLNMSGSAAAPLGAIAFTKDVGTFGIDGATPAAFVYATVPFPPYTLYDGFAVGSASWDAFYLYCETGLAEVYDEGISGAALFDRSATGICTALPISTAAHVSLPAFSIPAPTPVAGFTVSGSAITVDGSGTGTIVIDRQTMPLIVFGTVDCTACGSPGWYELHTVIWDAVRARVVFVIIYLTVGMTTSVQLAYARSLPDLADPIGDVTLPARWSVPMNPRVEGLVNTRGVPPPRL